MRPFEGATIRQPRATQWGIAAVVSGCLVGGGLAGFAIARSLEPTVLAIVGTLFLFQLGIVAWVGYRVDSHPVTVSAATLLTIARGSLAVVLGVFLLLEPAPGLWAWLPALLFGVAASLDGVDGYLARATDTVSALGSRLDSEMDSLLLLVGVTVAIRIGQAPTVFLLVGLARYGFVAGIAWRDWRGKAVGDLPPRTSRRVLGAGMMLVVFVLLSPVLGSILGQALAIGAMVPFLLGFCRDWWLVTRPTPVS